MPPASVIVWRLSPEVLWVLVYSGIHPEAALEFVASNSLLGHGNQRVKHYKNDIQSVNVTKSIKTFSVQCKYMCTIMAVTQTFAACEMKQNSVSPNIWGRVGNSSQINIKRKMWRSNLKKIIYFLTYPPTVILLSYHFTSASKSRAQKSFDCCLSRFCTQSGIICDFGMSIRISWPSLKHFMRQTLPTKNRKHFFKNIFWFESFSPRENTWQNAARR